jgi:hypothetical protein
MPRPRPGRTRAPPETPGLGSEHGDHLARTPAGEARKTPWFLVNAPIVGRSRNQCIASTAGQKQVKFPLPAEVRRCRRSAACSGGQAATVRSGAADVAVMHTPFGQRGLDAEVLLVEPRVAALPRGHRLAHRRGLRRADLAGETMPGWAGLV